MPSRVCELSDTKHVVPGAALAEQIALHDKLIELDAAWQMPGVLLPTTEHGRPDVHVVDDAGPQTPPEHLGADDGQSLSPLQPVVAARHAPMTQVPSRAIELSDM